MTPDAVASDVRRPAGRLSQESVLIVASSFLPMASAAVYRTLRFARYLPGLNWDVHVLTMHPRWYEAGTPFDESLLEKVPRSVEASEMTVREPSRTHGRTQFRLASRAGTVDAH